VVSDHEGKKQGKWGFILVVALELLGLVVAARGALPWAVEQTVLLAGESILVEVVVPGRFTFAAHPARAESRGERKAIISKSGHHVAMEILRGKELRRRILPYHPVLV